MIQTCGKGKVKYSAATTLVLDNGIRMISLHAFKFEVCLLMEAFFFNFEQW